jgi:hypothetical protein
MKTYTVTTKQLNDFLGDQIGFTELNLLMGEFPETASAEKLLDLVHNLELIDDLTSFLGE